ncbi:MAG TPA: LLM class flavin-dependent oxidoreductase [Thermomicrobiales bacterium]|nr:LLM class flavin-dependent oxidoreductase [Thermomicrobiales bacterium]
MQLGLFDIFQVDPLSQATDGEVYRQRLDDLALADELGFEVAFTAERHFMPTYRCPAPGTWIGAASQRTTRLRLGVLAYTLPIHAPAALAEEIAVLDHLSVGRLEVGLGLGHRPEELVALGVDPNSRIAAYQERLAVMRALWSGGQVTLETPLTRVHAVAIHPLTVQQPHPPLWYPGTDKGAAAWAASQGMNLAVGFAPDDRLRPATEAFALARRGRRLAAEQAGKPMPATRIALMRHVYVADNDEQAHAEMTDDLMRLHENVRGEQGEQAGGRADRRAEAEEGLADMLRNQVIIAGGPETVAGAIRESGKALDLDLFLANIYVTGIDTDRVHRALRLLGTEVGPRLASAGQTVPRGP